jgi:dipeptide/tripeptide permease
LQFPSQEASAFSGFFGGLVWFLPVFGGALADRMGFRKALALAYAILACAYFLLGSLGATWMVPIRQTVPLGVLVAIVLALPAFGVALVKPTVVGTTARSSKENVRSFGYSIYYTLVNIGGAAGPFVASFVRQRVSVENVFRVAALSVFLMFVGVLIFFREPKRDQKAQTPSMAQLGRNFLAVVTNPRFMLFLIIFTGFWIVYWQEFITLPLYVHNYISPTIDTELLLMTGPLVVIALTVVINLLTANVPPLVSITSGVLISSLGWMVLILIPTGLGAVLTLVVIALGEITLSPPYYDYVSRLAPEGQQGTYMGFAFLPLGIGSLVGGALGGFLLHFYGEVKHQPSGMWWVIMGVGIATAVLLWVYDRFMVRKATPELAQTAK